METLVCMLRWHYVVFCDMCVGNQILNDDVTPTLFAEFDSVCSLVVRNATLPEGCAYVSVCVCMYALQSWQ